MRDIILVPRAMADVQFWLKNDRKITRKIFELFELIARSPFEGTGKPEMLKGDLKGHWSCRIDKEHRIVYMATDSAVTIIACRFHYH